jgi:hypothetical protein
LAAAILNISLPFQAGAFPIALLSSLTPKTCGWPLEFLYYLAYTEIQIYPVLEAAILNLSFPVSIYGLRSVSDSVIKFTDPENMDLVSKMYFVA